MSIAPKYMSVLEHEALPIILTHAAVLEQQAVVCRLLATSKEMGAMIKEQCRGQVAAAFLMPNHPDSEAVAIAHSKQQLHFFAKWLEHHAHLLKVLEVSLFPPVADEAFRQHRGCITRSVPDHKGKAEVALAAALRGATASAGPLVLQVFRLLHGRSSAVCILEHLNPTLTSVVLEIGKTNFHLHPNQRLKGRVVLPSLRRTTPVLEKLTALTSLTIVCPQAHKLAPALPALTGLRDLSVAYLDVRRIAVLGQLPAKLTSLRFNVLERWEVYYDDQDDSDAEAEQQYQAVGDATSSGAAAAPHTSVPAAQGAEGQQQHQQNMAASTSRWQQVQAVVYADKPHLALGQLTSLQKLTSRTYRLQPQDVLPASLQVLELGYCRCVEPLLRLQRLQKLHMHKDAHLTASELMVFGSQLHSLQSLGLAYHNLEAAEASAAAWSKVPVASLMLDLNAASLQDRLLRQIGQLSHLTRLCLSGESVADSVIAVRAESFGGILQQLSGLQELQLHSLRVEAAQPAAGRDTETQGVCQSAAASLDDMTPLTAAVASLPRLSSLTLSDVGCSSGEWLSSSDIAPLAAAAQLTCLHIFMSWLDDAGVAALVKNLRGLRRLGLDHCARVTDTAAQVAVVELTQLTWLSVWGTRVRDRKQVARSGLELVGV